MRTRLSTTTPHQGWRNVFTDLAVYGAAFGFVNAVSYLYLVIVGRTLSAAEFGVFNALSGVVAIAGSFATSLQLAVTQAAAFSPGRSAFAAFMRTTWRIAFPIIILLTLAALPFASAVGANATQAAICGVSVLTTFPGCTAMGFLAGIGKIRTQAGINLLGAIARLATGWPLMLIGAGVTGAILGYFLNFTVVLVLAWYVSSQLSAGWLSAQTSRAPRLRLDASAIATFVLAFAPFNLDQLQVQALAAPSLGGDYAALATMAKLVFFSAYPITAVVYPRLLGEADLQSRFRLIAGAAGAIIAVSGIVAWGLAAFPELWTRVFFGDRFQHTSPYAGWLAFGVACFSLSVLGTHVLIAWACPIGFIPSLVAFGAGLALFTFRHDSLVVLVTNQVWVYGLQFVLVLALLALTVGRSLKRSRTAEGREVVSP